MKKLLLRFYPTFLILQYTLKIREKKKGENIQQWVGGFYLALD